MSDTPKYYIRNSDQKRFRPIAVSNIDGVLLETSVGNTITVTTEALMERFTAVTGETHIREYTEKPKIQLPKPPTAERIMQEAIKTMAERGKTYDTQDKLSTFSPEHPAPVERSMGKVVLMFNTLTGHTLTEEQGWDFMVLIKLARASNGYKADNFVDGAAYFGLAGECAAEKNCEGN